MSLRSRKHPLTQFRLANKKAPVPIPCLDISVYRPEIKDRLKRMAENECQIIQRQGGGSGGFESESESIVCSYSRLRDASGSAEMFQGMEQNGVDRGV
jgi:hypothetical protein